MEQSDEGRMAGNSPPQHTQQIVEGPRPKRLRWEDVPIGYWSTWEKLVTEDGVFAYADGVEDYHPWYGSEENPFGFPIAPPLMVPFYGNRTTEALGLRVGWIATDHETELVAPVRVGARVRYEGKIVDKFEKRGRYWIVEHVDAYDADTGNLLSRETKRYLARYERDQTPGDGTAG